MADDQRNKVNFRLSPHELQLLSSKGEEEGFASASVYARHLLRGVIDKILEGENPADDNLNLENPAKPKKKTLYYARHEDKIYPLFKQHGFWSPCIDKYRLNFFWPESLKEPQNQHYEDYTERLTSWERLWLTTWISHFDKLITYYKFLYNENGGVIEHKELEAIVHACQKGLVK